MPTTRSTSGTPRHALPSSARIALYLRISTDEEHQPFSLEAQEHRLTAFVGTQPGWTLARTPYVDQISGAYAERPALDRLLRDAALGLFDVVLVYRVDRFARSLKVLVHLLDELDHLGVAFRSATEPIDTSTPTGRMLVQLLGVFAEFERATIIDRVVAGMERKAARGEWTSGSRPYGYTIDPTTHYLLVAEHERPVVEAIFDRYVNARLGTQSIAAHLNERGHRTKSGRPWSHASVLTVLRNRAYVGEIYFRETWHRAPHQPILDPDLFDAAQQLLAERGEDVGRRRSNTSDYLATGKLRCGKCQRPYVGTTAHGRRYTYRYYTCWTRHRYGTTSCDAERLPANELDAALLDAIHTTYERAGIADDAARAAWESIDAEQAANAAELTTVDADLRKTEAAIERYLLAFENGRLTDASCETRVRALNQRLADLRARRDQLADALPTTAALPTDDDVAWLRAHVHDVMTSGDTSQRKIVVHALIEHVVVHGRDDIVPYVRVPAVTNDDGSQVRILGGSVGAAGIEPATARV